MAGSKTALGQQVNIRLSQHDYDVVRALIFLDDDKGSASEVLRGIVEAYLSREAKAPEVASALEALAERRARVEGKLSRLPATSSTADSA